MNERKKAMTDNNRVLTRKGARMLSEEEIDLVTGSLRTLTACTIDPELRGRDGDAGIPGEC